MGEFTKALAAFGDKANLNLESTVEEIIRIVGFRLVELSPVGDGNLWASPPPKGYEGGQFKANWRADIDRIDYTTTNDIDPTGEISLVQIYSKAIPFALGRICYITNSLPYAKPLEDGHSSQAPAGMVSLTVLEFGSIVEKAVLKVVRI